MNLNSSQMPEDFIIIHKIFGCYVFYNFTELRMLFRNSCDIHILKQLLLESKSFLMSSICARNCSFLTVFFSSSISIRFQIPIHASLIRKRYMYIYMYMHIYMYIYFIYNIS